MSSSDLASQTDQKEYQQSFYKKIAVSTAFFGSIGFLCAIAVNIILNPENPLRPTNLDAQTVANFFIFTFATGVAFAGALVVICRIPDDHKDA